MSDKGFIVIDRKITEWRWWKNNTARGLWLYLLVNANWKTGFNGDGTEIKRGQVCRSLRNIAADNGVNIKTIRYWLKKFEETGEIEVIRAHRYNVICIVNYAKYQDVPTNKGTITGTNTGTITGTDRTKEQGNKETKKQYSRQAEPPTWEEVESFAYAIGYIDPLPFYRQMENSGWTYKGEPVNDWRRLLRGFKRQQDMDRSKSMASHQRQTEHLPEYMKQPQPEPEGTDPELMAEMLEWQRKNGGQT